MHPEVTQDADDMAAICHADGHGVSTDRVYFELDSETGKANS